MQHLSVVAKLLEHALAGNTGMVKDYAALLIEKLQADGEDRQVAILERILHRLPPGETVSLIALHTDSDRH